MKLESKHYINGKIVEKTGEILLGHEVFLWSDEDQYNPQMFLYLVKDGVVVEMIQIYAGGGAEGSSSVDYHIGEEE